MVHNLELKSYLGRELEIKDLGGFFFFPGNHIYELKKKVKMSTRQNPKGQKSWYARVVYRTPLAKITYEKQPNENHNPPLA